MDLTDVIKEKRPKLSDGSLKTYKSILTNIYKKCYPNDDIIDLKKFDDVDCIMEHLKEVPFSKRKTTLAALTTCVLTIRKDAINHITAKTNCSLLFFNISIFIY